MSKFQAALFFEAARDTTIHAGIYTVPIKAREIVQVAYVTLAETADDARERAVQEIKNITIDGQGSWLVSIYERCDNGYYKQISFDDVV